MSNAGKPSADMTAEERKEAMEEHETIIEDAEEGGYIASVPDLPGCVSEGETKEEALANIKDAIEGYRIVLSKRGFKAFVEALDSDEEPNEALKRAAADYNAAVKSGEIQLP